MSRKKHFTFRREVSFLLTSSPCWQLRYGIPARGRVTMHFRIPHRSFGLALGADKQLGGMMANHGSIGGRGARTSLGLDLACIATLGVPHSFAFFVFANEWMTASPPRHQAPSRTASAWRRPAVTYVTDKALPKR